MRVSNNSIGLDNKTIQASVEILTVLLGTTYTLYLKTQNYHWNIQSSQFCMFHDFFQKLYEELNNAIDEIAEKIRILGENVDGTFSIFQKNSLITEDTTPHKDPVKMLATLLKDHECIIKFLRESITKLNATTDFSTTDFMIERLSTHEKTVWMLQSHLA